MSRLKSAAGGLAVALAVIAGGCGSEESDSGSPGGGGLDPTPERLDGSSSQEFEQSDIDAAESASPEVQAYCSGAVSEAQRLGCLSHVDEEDIP